MHATGGRAKALTGEGSAMMGAESNEALIRRPTRVVAEGFDFPEGPVVDEGGSVLLVNVRTDVVNRVTPDG